MNSAAQHRTCPSCGAAIPANAPQGICPKCLMAAAAVATEAGQTGGKRPEPPSLERLAAAFPQLEVIEFIGQGGMGAVYKARQKQLDRVVALKVLPPGIGGDPAFAERFTREAKALAKLLHPNIVALFEFGQANGIYYLLMEYVDGVSLGQLLRSSRVSPREALAIVPQICDALQYAHDQGIVHRDIKPENILLDRRGRVKVADFGLAKLVEMNAPLSLSLSPLHGERAAARPGEGTPPILTDAGKVMGTPAYMAPEQAEHPGEVDHRADIYALGVVFYQMLTGELPTGKTFEPPSKKVVIDVRLDEVVLRALEKEPERRYQQVSEVKTMVETIVNTPPSGGSGSGAPEVSPPVPGPAKRAYWLPVVVVRDGQRVIHWPGVLLDFAGWCGVHAVITFVVAALLAPFWGYPYRIWFLVPFWWLVGALWLAWAIKRDFRAPLERLSRLDKRSEGEAKTMVETILTTPPQTRSRGDWRTRVAVVGLRNGRRVINWPAVALDAVALTVVLALASLAGSAIFHFPPHHLPLLVLWLGVLSAIPIAIYLGFTSQPIGRLTSLDGHPDPSLRHIFLVGRRNGKAVLHWPGVLMSFLLTLTIAEAAATVTSLILFDGINTLTVLIALWGATIVIGIGIYRGWTMPVDQLMSLDEPHDGADIPLRSLPLFVEQAGQRRPYWPGVLQLCGTVGLVVGATVLVITIALWLLDAPVRLTFQPGGILMLLMWLAASIVMFMAASRLGLDDARRPQPAEPAASSSPETPPRFSRTAIVGAAWAPAFFIALFLSFWQMAPVVVPAGAKPPGPAWWQYLMMFTVLPIGVTAPFATTILGCIALTRIRRSAGRLYGLGLALFDALLFPLLTLDILIGWMIRYAVPLVSILPDVDHWNPLPMSHWSNVNYLQWALPTLLTTGIADWLIIRWAWRAAKNPYGGALLASVPPIAPVRFANSMFFALGLGVMMAVVLGVALWKTDWQRNTGQGVVRYRVFEADANLVDKLVRPESRTRGDLPSGSKLEGSPANATAQMVEISTVTLAQLLPAADVQPKLLEDRRREVDFWPKVADTWGYAVSFDQQSGTGGAAGFLGMRRVRGQLELRVQYRVTHSVATRDGVGADIFYEGNAPTGALTFFIPFARADGTRRYLVIAFEVNQHTQPVKSEATQRQFAELAPALVEAVKRGDKPKIEKLVGGKQYVGINEQLASLHRQYDLSGLKIDAVLVKMDSRPKGKIFFSPLQKTGEPDRAMILNFVVELAGKWRIVATQIESTNSIQSARDGLIGAGFTELQLFASVPAAATGAPSHPPLYTAAGMVGDRLRHDILARLVQERIYCDRLRVSVSPDLTQATCELAGLRRRNGWSAGEGFTPLKGSFAIERITGDRWHVTGTGDLSHLQLTIADPDRLPGVERPQRLAANGAGPNDWPQRARGSSVDGPPIPVDESQSAFGPVIERVVTNEVDLDTGSLKLEELKGSDHYSDALYEDPVFVFAASTERIQLTSNDWDGLSPEQLQAALDKRINSSDMTFNKKTAKLPVALGFRTSSGRMGILQILGFTDNPRGVKIRYKLVQTARVPATVPIEDAFAAVSPSALAEPPKLRFLAWQDENKDLLDWRAWHPDGTPVKDTNEVRVLRHILPVPVGVSSTSEVKKNPRFVFLWFSHPMIENNSFARVTLFDDAGNHLAEAAGSIGQRVGAPGDYTGNLGWIRHTVSPGYSTNMPAAVNVRLEYGIGPWKTAREGIPPDYDGAMGLGKHVMLGSIGQTANGQAFVSINRSDSEALDEQYGFLALLRDGRAVEHTGFRTAGYTNLLTETAEFSVKLDEIKTFQLRTRPIKKVEFKNVPLPAQAPAATSGTLSFGPVIERELFVNEPMTNAFLDLETGAVSSAPPDIAEALRKGQISGLANGSRICSWMRATGTDVMPQGGNQPFLAIADGLAGGMGDSPEAQAAVAFDTVSVSTVTTSARRVEAARQREGPPNSEYWFDPQVVSAFQTREGGMGVLQIVAFTDNPRGVKIRYKLVRAAGESSAEKPIVKQAYLPDVDRRDVGTVLDLASGQMLFNPGGTNEAAIPDYFDKMGRGDIGWDRVLLTLRGARVSEFKDGSWVPLTPKRESRGCGAYPLELPVRLLITTAAGTNYTVDVLAGAKDGVNVEYQPGRVPPVQPTRVGPGASQSAGEAATQALARLNDMETTPELRQRYGPRKPPSTPPTKPLVPPFAAQSAEKALTLQPAVYFDVKSGHGLDLDHAKVVDQGSPDVDAVLQGFQLLGRGISAACVKLPYEIESRHLTAEHVLAKATRFDENVTAWPLKNDIGQPAEIVFRTASGTVGAFAAVGYGQAKNGDVLNYRVECRLLSASDGASAQTVIPSDGPPWKVVLPSGTEIELVAVSDYPDMTAPWWRPDGSKLDAPPIDPVDLDITSYVDPKMRKIELVFRLGGKANQPAYESQLRAADGRGVWWAGRRSRDGKFAEDLKVVGTMVPVDAKTVGLDLLVAAGPWETVTTSDGRKPAGPLGAATPGDPASGSGPSTVITTRFDPEKFDAQVIGLDADGGKHVVRGFDIRRGANDAGANFLFQGLTPGQFKSFTLQTRPNNERLRLTDVSLVPGQRTDAKLVAEKIPGEPDAPAQPGALSFGPVIERVLRDPSESRTNCFLGFETGAMPMLPADLPVTNYPAVWEWAKAQDVDAVANTSQEGRCLEGYELAVAGISDDDWEKPPTLERMNAWIVAVKFRDWERGGSQPMSRSVMSVKTVTTNAKQSRTFLFQTRRGTLGLLQFLEYTDAPRGWVKIRYKLVQARRDEGK